MFCCMHKEKKKSQFSVMNMINDNYKYRKFFQALKINYSKAAINWRQACAADKAESLRPYR